MEEKTSLIYELLSFLINDFSPNLLEVKSLLLHTVKHTDPEVKPDNQSSAGLFVYHPRHNRPSNAALSRQLDQGVSQSHNLQIEMQINGYLIPYATFDVKLTRSSGKVASIGTKVRQPMFPFVLDQYLELHVLAKEALDTIKALEDENFFEKIYKMFGKENLGKIGFSINDNSSWEKLSQGQAVELVKSVFEDYFASEAEENISSKPFLDCILHLLTNVRKGLHIFTQPSLHEFPYLLPKTNPAFQPDLPEEVLVQVFIRGGNLYVASYLVEFEAEQLSKKKKKDKRSQARSRQALNYSFLAGTEQDLELKGRVYDFDDRRVEVVDQVTVAFSLITLQEDVENWTSMYHKLRLLEQRLNALYIVEKAFSKERDLKQGVSTEQEDHDIPHLGEPVDEPSSYLF